jgi:hypothetical protein
MDKQNKKFEVKTYKIFQILPEMYCVLSIREENLPLLKFVVGSWDFFCKIVGCEYDVFTLDLLKSSIKSLIFNAYIFSIMF